MSRIYWDAMLFVYLIEDDPRFGPVVQRVADQMQTRRDALCTSVFTLAELLVVPYRDNNTVLVQQIREAVAPPLVELIGFTPETADRFARIRAVSTRKVSPSDAIHLACAAQAGVDLFLTNDYRLQGLTVEGIHFIASLESGLF